MNMSIIISTFVCVLCESDQLAFSQNAAVSMADSID